MFKGSACALPSIMNLVESNANAILHLPLECICELFLHYLLMSTSSVTTAKKPTAEKLNAVCLSNLVYHGHEYPDLSPVTLGRGCFYESPSFR